ncbi:hypothetical protein EG865_15640, partial [Enterococcus faecalis]
ARARGLASRGGAVCHPRRGRAQGLLPGGRARVRGLRQAGAPARAQPRGGPGRLARLAGARADPRGGGRRAPAPRARGGGPPLVLAGGLPGALRARPAVGAQVRG